MSVHQTEAITLRTYPFAETHKIAVFLTRDIGQVRTMAHGAKSRKRNRFGSSLEPLTHVRIAFSRRQNQELATLQSCEIIKAHPAHQLSWEQNLHFSYFTELLIEFTQEERESERLFRLILAVLDAIPTVPVRLLARYFEFWLLQFEGVLPDLRRRLTPELNQKLLELMRLHPADLRSEVFSGAEVRRLEKLAGTLIEHHLEKPLKTRKMLGELL